MCFSRRDNASHSTRFASDQAQNSVIVLLRYSIPGTRSILFLIRSNSRPNLGPKRGRRQDMSYGPSDFCDFDLGVSCCLHRPLPGTREVCVLRRWGREVGERDESSGGGGWRLGEVKWKWKWKRKWKLKLLLSDYGARTVDGDSKPHSGPGESQRQSHSQSQRARQASGQITNSHSPLGSLLQKKFEISQSGVGSEGGQVKSSKMDGRKD
jgi:hypothetical protein